MGRLKAFDPDDALDRAMRTFWQHGYDATSVDDIVVSTGVNRASLYGTFGDKKQIFLRAFERYVGASTVANLDAATEPGSAREALVALFERLVSRSCDGRNAGCMITNTVAEFGSRDPEVLAHARQALARIENALDRLLRRAQAFGELPADADARARARHLMATMQGVQVISKINSDPRLLKQICDQAVSAAFA
ncbi:TetR/AcrR family transcriptional regulator [Pacificispira sp.]|uniref:TetR/AcrR family transcriptional regulator n=1 Tax=Pacificispira sp. TaxID=2888761 RepID=UPI003BA98A4D